MIPVRERKKCFIQTSKIFRSKINFLKIALPFPSFNKKKELNLKVNIFFSNTIAAVKP
jgi:hypothetical protein